MEPHPAELDFSSFGPVKAGLSVRSPFDIDLALPPVVGDVIRAPVSAGGSGSVEAPNCSLPDKAQAGLSACSLAASSDFLDSGSCTVGATPSDVGICNELELVFQFQKIRMTPLHKLAGIMRTLPPNSLQLGVSLAQLLLSHPRDGQFIRTFLQQTWSKEENTPTRRDLMPFQFNPSVGAAIKLIQHFPYNDVGVLRVCTEALKRLGRQQRKKLLKEGARQLWRWLVVMVMNGEYLDWNPGVPLTPAKPNLGQVASLEMIGKMVENFIGDPLAVQPMPCFKQLLLSKSIDYGGEEVSHALPLRLEELLPGLPDPAVGGSLDAEKVADEEVRTWLRDPQLCLKPRELWPTVVPKAKINASKTEWYRLVGELYKRNLVAIIEKDDIFKVDGEAVLNGAFAVNKSGTPAAGEVRIIRLIMNMVPANSYQLLMRGDLNTLTSSSSWGSLVLPPGHTQLWSSDDQRGAFYAWRLPLEWRPFMSFKWPVPGELVGRSQGEWCFVCSAVIPMGWINAVSLFQHLHRRLGLAQRPLGAELAPEKEWRRDRAVPQPSGGQELSWVQYYLDDFDAPEVVPSACWEKLQGVMSETHKEQRAAYARQGVEISEKKAQVRQPVVIRMGALVDGLEGTVAAPLEKRFEVLGFALWVLSKARPKNKGLLMVLGRLVRCFEFRRPLMSLLRNCWPKTHVHARYPISLGTFSALIRSCVMLPMAVSNLRTPVDGLVSASDASEQGGGLCVASQLTQEGRDTLTALKSETYQKTRCMPFQSAGAMPITSPRGPRIFVLSLFDGVAAIMCALTRLPCQVVGFAASEIDRECRRLVRKRWPGVIELGKVESIDDKVIEALVNALGFEIDCFLISAGSPCQDLTVLLAGREGLAGSRSRLFFEIPRIFKICQRRFGDKVFFMVENVFSMTEAARLEFSRVLGVPPVLIEADDLGWVRRPRLYWCAWPVEAQEDEHMEIYPSYHHWKFQDVRGKPDHWVEGDWYRLGKGPLPTFTRALPRDRPPLRPAGLEGASDAARQRWMEDRYRFQVYQYEDHNLLWHQGSWRLPTLEEREVLMGFDRGYISSALSPKLTESERFNIGCGMIGNTFHVPSIMMVCHSLLKLLDKNVSPRCLTTMLDNKRIAPGGWADFPTFTSSNAVDPKSPELVHEILRQGERAGTDIRLDVGIPFRFKAFPRAGLRTSYFQWKIIQGYKWKFASHINCLELQAVVNSLNWRLRKLGNHRKRVLHLVDSQVVASIVAKGRTSSFRLRKALQKLNQLLLASGIKLSIAYCHTTDNPADIPSRWADRKKIKRNAATSERESTWSSSWFRGPC